MNVAHDVNECHQAHYEVIETMLGVISDLQICLAKGKLARFHKRFSATLVLIILVKYMPSEV